MDVMSIGRLAATKQTWRHDRKTVRDIVASVIDDNPRAGEARLRSAFHEAVRNDDEAFEAVADYAFDAAMLAISRQKQREPTVVTAEDRAKAAKVRAREAANHAKQVEFIKEQIILLNQELPNGKRARFCTLDYLYRLGGAYRLAGKKDSRKTVGETYTEEQYRSKLAGLT